MEYSLIIPVYKAEKTLRLIVPALVAIMNREQVSFEIVLVDDASPDNSWNVLRELSAEFEELRVIRFDKNYGQLAATTCGLLQAKGKVLVTMDDDLQFSPEELPAFMNYYHQHKYQLIFGIPEKKMNSKSLDYTRTVMRILFKHIFLTRLSEVEYFSSFRMINAELMQTGKLKNLFMVWKLHSDEIGNFPVNHFPTKKVLTSYTFFKRVLHFRPYLLLAAQKTGFTFGIIGSLFCLAFFISNNSLLLVAGILTLLSFVIGIVAFSILKKTEKVIYQIESSYP